MDVGSLDGDSTRVGAVAIRQVDGITIFARVVGEARAIG